MTYEEAIRIIQNIYSIPDCYYCEHAADGDCLAGCIRSQKIKKEAYQLVIETLEKQISAKPIKRGGYYRCPDCGLPVEVDDNEGYATEIYPACRCGKIIDWGGVEGVSKIDQKWLGGERFD